LLQKTKNIKDQAANFTLGIYLDLKKYDDARSF
jgi:hypothetical protein